jgi:hypothetical protein
MTQNGFWRQWLHRRMPVLGLLSAIAVVATTVPASADSPTPSASISRTEARPSAADGHAGKGAQAQSLTFGIRPFRPEGADPRGSFLFRAAPGQTLHDEVSIFNYAGVPLSFQVYATDAITSAGGGFGLLEHAQKPKDAGTWVSLLTPKTGGIRVPAGVRVDIPFTVVVPDSATPGDHVGGIVVSLPGTQLDGKGNAVRVDSRVSALMSVRIAGEVRPGLAVTTLTGSFATAVAPLAQGKARIHFIIHNQGNISQGATYDVTLHSPLGFDKVLPQGKISGILPGDAVDVSLPSIDLWPAVRYTATVNVRGAPAVGDPVAPPVTARVSFWAWPLPQLLLLIGLVAVWILLRWLKRRRSRKAAVAAARALAPATVVPADAVVSG